MYMPHRYSEPTSRHGNSTATEMGFRAKSLSSRFTCMATGYVTCLHQGTLSLSLSQTLAEMWSPSTTSKDLDAGSPRYGRPRPRRSRPIRIDERESPFRSSSSAVPFSWEHRPGIPKTPSLLTSRPTGPFLPFPPSLRSAPAGSSREKRPVTASISDPFATALAECAKDPAGPAIEEFFARGGGSAVERRRRGPAAALSVSDRLGPFGLRASCKATCAVADSAVRVPRSGPSNRRPVQR